jgi:hypothetical protein
MHCVCGSLSDDLFKYQMPSNAFFFSDINLQIIYLLGINIDAELTWQFTHGICFTHIYVYDFFQITRKF